MIRLVSFSLGSNGYLNFMGNEFGHPEWIDFPREGNNWSYKYCRRQWELADRTDLRYYYLNEFDHAMMALDVKYGILASTHQYVRTSHDSDKVLVYERGPLLFVFNWNPSQSFEKYLIYCRLAKNAKVIMSTDDKDKGGHHRVNHLGYEIERVSHEVGKFLLYIPSRCAIVFELEQWSNKFNYIWSLVSLKELFSKSLRILRPAITINQERQTLKLKLAVFSVPPMPSNRPILDCLRGSEQTERRKLQDRAVTSIKIKQIRSKVQWRQVWLSDSTKNMAFWVVSSAVHRFLILSLNLMRKMNSTSESCKSTRIWIEVLFRSKEKLMVTLSPNHRDSLKRLLWRNEKNLRHSRLLLSTTKEKKEWRRGRESI